MISRPATNTRSRPELGDELLVAPRRLRLALERAQLAAHLAQQVLQAQQVGLGGVEPALGLLLALAVLEDAGRLLDDRPPLLGPGVEHGVDLALADDHVLLAADAGVGEQLLHVEQPARHAVDRVLALAAAEQDAGERDLVELDRQQAGELSSVRLTSARPSAGRFSVPAKMTSSIFCERTDRGACAPSTQATASTMLDLPDPLGPTTTVTPGSRVMVVASANDLKPLRVRLFRNTVAPTLVAGQRRRTARRQIAVTAFSAGIAGSSGCCAGPRPCGGSSRRRR